MTDPARRLPGDQQEIASRRDVLVIAGSAFAAAGSLAALWPLGQQMLPDASTRALAAIEVDLSPIEVGQAITVIWRGKPVFIRHRTPVEIAAEQVTRMPELIDRTAAAAGLPESAPAIPANRVKPGYEQWIVPVGACTHLGCVPLGNEGEFKGWMCPCHGSVFDTSGRIRQGPAPTNLPVPPYAFTSDNSIRIG